MILNTYNIIQDNPNEWKIIKIQVESDVFKNEIKTPSKFYRKLSNSKSSVGGMTNRQYFKQNVFGGFYTHQNQEGFIEILLCLKGTELSNLQLQVRIRKILPTSKVEVLDFDGIQENLFKKGKTQMVGGYYFNHLQKTT